MTGNTPIEILMTKGVIVEGDEPSSCADAKALTMAIARGDETAFNVFYHKYSPRVYRLLLAVTRGDAGICGELHQRVMIKAARKIKVIATHGEVWAWIAAVVRNEWRDYCRARARTAQRFVSGANEAEQATAEEGKAGLGEKAELLEEALRELKAADRELVECFYLDEVSQAELGEKSGRTAKAIECAIARIRARLKKMIEAKR